MYIYRTINLINNKFYVGKSKRDVTESKKYYGSGLLLKKAIKKYGIKNFKKEILDECETIDELNIKEKYWIEKLNSTNMDIGYNLAVGGSGGDTYTYNINRNIGQEKRIKTLREKCYNNPEWRKNCSNGMKGIKKSSTENMKKPKTEEHKKRVSESIKKKYNDPEYVKRMNEGKKRRWENYYKQKIGDN